MDGPKAELVVEEGREVGLVHPLRPGKVILVGREGQFRIDDPSLSRRHCEIDFGGGTYRIRDLGSRWGTTLNGVPVGEAHVPLVDGDRIRIGTHVVRIDVQGAPPPPPPGEGATVAIDARTLQSLRESMAAESEAEVELVAPEDDLPAAPPTRTPDPIELASVAVAAPVPPAACLHCRAVLVPGTAFAPGAVPGYCAPCLDQYPMLGRTLAHHRCVRVLGAGGMGVVYLGEHTVLGRKAAVKTLRGIASSDPVLVQRLLREATAGGRLSHPNIVAVHDTGEEDGIAYVIMEYVPGENLADVLKRERRLPAKRVLWIMTQLADAMAAAFLLGYIHRDIKPENILLSEGDAIKVTDFGLAKNLTDTELVGLTRTGQVLGTMVYIAPEQIVSSKGSDQRADIYSLGATFYHLLAGRPPFDSREAVRLLMQIRNEEPPSLQTLVPEIPHSVARIVHRCLRKDPADRYQSPEALLADCIQAQRDL